MQVQPAPAGASPAVAASAPAAAQAPVAEAASPEPTAAAAAPPAATGTKGDGVGQSGTNPIARGYWPGFAALFGVAWLVSTALWLRARSVARSRPDAVDSGPDKTVQRARAARQALQRACRENNAAAARHALLDWGAARWPDAPPRRLDEVAARLPPEADRVLRELDRVLYANSVAYWEGGDTWRHLAPMLAEAKKAGMRRDRDAALPSLYAHEV